MRLKKQSFIYILFGITVMTAFLNSKVISAKSAPIILDLSCNKDCTKIYFSFFENNQTHSIYYDTVKDQLFEIVSDTNELIEQVSLTSLPVASMGTKIISLDLKNYTYNVILSENSKKYYPVESNDNIYFSESSLTTSGTLNTNQRRALYSVNINGLDKTRLLPGIVAYQIGRPTISSKCLVVDLILPINEYWSPLEAIKNTKFAISKQNFSFCIDPIYLKENLDISQITNDFLFIKRDSVEQLTVDFFNKTAVYYSVWPTVGWIAEDLENGRIIYKLPGEYEARYIVSYDGATIIGIQSSSQSINIFNYSVMSDNKQLIATYKRDSKQILLRKVDK